MTMPATGGKEVGGAGGAEGGAVPDFTACGVCGDDGHAGNECEDLFHVDLPVKESDPTGKRAFYLVRLEEDFISTDDPNPDPDRVVRVSYVDLKNDQGRASDNTEPFLVERSLCADSDHRKKIVRAVAAAAAKEAKEQAKLDGVGDGHPLTPAVLPSRSPASRSSEIPGLREGTGIWKAAQYGWGEAIRRLLVDGANIDERGGPLESTPLHEAAWSGCSDTYKGRKAVTMVRKAVVVRQLLDAGADVSATDTNGDTPLQYAERQGHQEVARLLRDFAEVTPPADPPELRAGVR